MSLDDTGTNISFLRNWRIEIYILNYIFVTDAWSAYGNTLYQSISYRPFGYSKGLPKYDPAHWLVTGGRGDGTGVGIEFTHPVEEYSQVQLKAYILHWQTNKEIKQRPSKVNQSVKGTEMIQRIHKNLNFVLVCWRWREVRLYWHKVH